MVPNGWKLVEANDICSSISVGVVIKPSQYYVEKDKGVKAFRSANVREGVINDSDWVYFSDEGHKANKKSQLKVGDVLIVRTGYPGTACVVTPEFEGSNAIDIVIARPKSDLVTSEYLCSYTNSEIGKSQVLNLKGGMAQQHLNVGAYKVLKIKLPPLGEQQKIANILTTWDKAISTTERLIENSDQQKKALMHQLLTGKKRLLDESGERFEDELGKSTLSKLCRISTGKKDVNEGNPNGEYPFYTCAKEHTFSDNYSFDCEALLIAGNGNIGTTHYHNGKFEAYQRTYILKDFEDINVRYLFQFLLYALSREVERNKQHGAMPYIKVGFLNDFIVLTPSLAEQQKIATVLTNADKEIELLEQQLADLQQEKKALMQVLLTGKKRVVVDGEVA